MTQISVVIAAYNHGRYLADALESALGQTLPPAQIVVVDDGSTDETPEVLRRFAAEPRIECLRLEHAGQPAAKNAGIRACRHAWIAFLDADDLWAPNKLERQLQIADDETGVIYSDYAPMDAEGRSLTPPPQRNLPQGDVLAAMFRDNFVCFSSSVVHRRVFDRVGLFDESIPMAIDYELWLRAARHFRFAAVAQPLVRYRSGHANLSRRAEERVGLALAIMDRFVAQSRGDARLSSSLVRQAYAETYCTLGLLRRERSTGAALAAYAQALRYRPHGAAAWRGLIAALTPEAARRWYRWAKGAPLDWRLPQPMTESPAAS